MYVFTCFNNYFILVRGTIVLLKESIFVSIILTGCYCSDITCYCYIFDVGLAPG